MNNVRVCLCSFQSMLVLKINNMLSNKLKFPHSCTIKYYTELISILCKYYIVYKTKFNISNLYINMSKQFYNYMQINLDCIM